MTPLAIVWRRLDNPGHEFARLVPQDSQWLLAGTAVFAQNHQPCRLDYFVVCNSKWQTQSGIIEGWHGAKLVKMDIAVNDARQWKLNGVPHPELNDCEDLDLSFSPSTNLLPIRRLSLVLGQSGKARAAWLDFPSLELKPLDQRYRRIGQETYRYETEDLTTELQVNAASFVTEYEGKWRVEADV